MSVESNMTNMPGDHESLDELTGKPVLVKVQGANDMAGTLKTYDEDFSLTLTGEGQPEDVHAGDFEIEFIDGERTLNGTNVISVEQWDRPHAEE